MAGDSVGMHTTRLFSSASCGSSGRNSGTGRCSQVRDVMGAFLGRLNPRKLRCMGVYNEIEVEYLLGSLGERRSG